MEIDQYINTITAFISLQKVDQYLVGITGNFNARRRSYKRIEFLYFFELKAGLTKTEALSLEEKLFKALVIDKTSVTYTKYHHKKRDGPYHPSTGGIDCDSYFLYVAAF